jgi:DNA-directed RNA polymerase beta subunit
LSETPEGKQCGSVEHLAATAFITNESFDSQTLAYRLVQKKTSRRHDVTNINIVVRLLMSKYNSINEIYKMADAKGQPLISEIKTPEIHH